MASLQQALAPVAKSLGIHVEVPKVNGVDKIDDFPIPTNCRYCNAKVKLVNNNVIYGISYGSWPYAYLCDNDDCGAYVGVHKNTKIPLGTLADYRLREARKAAKDVFNRLWNGPNAQMSRTQAYQWLAKQLNIDPKTCHIGWFEVDKCERTVELCKKFAKR